MKLSVMATMAAVLALTMQATSTPLRIVSSLDLNRYLGKWHEVARLPNRFQKQCVSDVVAEYGLRTDGRIDVLNTCRTWRRDDRRGAGHCAQGGRRQQ